MYVSVTARVQRRTFRVLNRFSANIAGEIRRRLGSRHSAVRYENDVDVQRVVVL
jgi:hypothetical protein